MKMSLEKGGGDFGPPMNAKKERAKIIRENGIFDAMGERGRRIENPEIHGKIEF